MRDLRLILWYFIWFYATIINFEEVQVNGNVLAHGGDHVCYSTIRQPYSALITSYRIGYYRSHRSCGWFGWGWCEYSRKTVVSYQNQEVRHKQTYRYFCCSGWAQQGNKCPIPICKQGCKNGKCTEPSKCKCLPGFGGNFCEKDINECLKNPCDHTCVNTYGSYRCSCLPGYKKTNLNPISPQCTNINDCANNPCKCAQSVTNNKCVAKCIDLVRSFRCVCNSGYQLLADRSTCTDINECNPPLNHCQQNCINTIGSHKCSCWRGYLLSSDGLNCSDVDECAILNGGCSQVCYNKPGTYKCYCRRGFRLHPDGKRCEDINECKEHNHCDKFNGFCRNVIGSYRCFCRNGYQLWADKKTCLDINECAIKDANGCQHNCTNTKGSYICSCLAGYQRAPDGKRCYDINECMANTTVCKHICINTVGSYKCKCKNGHGLEDDKHGCIAYPCRTVTSPTDGSISCSGHVTDDTCTYSCAEGFDLIGPDKRTCLPISRWSGIDPTCKRKTCPEVKPPNYGAVLLPCVEQFGFQCFKRCSKGYYLQGSDSSTCVMERNQTAWTGQDTQCKVETTCIPNPCRNGGKCSITRKNSYTCDCTGTLFDGNLCEKNIVIIPDYPPLVVNEPSMKLKIYVKPSKFVRVEMLFSNEKLIKFTPQMLEISHPEQSAEFTVTVSASGVYDVHYRVIGDGQYNQPKPSRIYVFEKRSSLLVDFDLNFLEKELASFVVNGLTFHSTCNFTKGIGGVLFVSRNNNLNLPLSFIGITEKHLSDYANEKVIDMTEDINSYWNERMVGNSKSFCDGNRSASQDKQADYILKNGIFPALFFKETAKLLPFWLRIVPLFNQPTYTPQNLVLKISSGTVLKTHRCFESIFPPMTKQLIKDSGTYAVYHTKLPTMTQSMRNIFHTSQTMETCYVVDLDSSNLYISSNSLLNLIDQSSPDHIFTKLSSRFVAIGNNSAITINKDHLIMLEARLQMQSFEGSFHFKTIVKMNDIEKKFNSPNIGWGNGKLDYDITLDFLGKKLYLDGRETLSEQLLSYGVNGKALLWIKIMASDDIRSSESSAIRFKPLQNINIEVPLQVSGGQMVGINNAALLKTNLRNFIRNEKQSMILIEELSLMDKDFTAILSKKATRMFSQLNKTYHYLSGHADGTNYGNLTKYLEQIKYSCADLTASINSFVYSSQNDVTKNMLVAKLQRFLKRFKRIKDLKALPDMAPFTFKDINGLIIKYNGSLCIYNLCFPELKNVRIVSASNNEFLTINADCYPFRASHRLQFQQNDSISLNISKYTEQFHGKMSARIFFYDQYYPVDILINEYSFRYKFFTNLSGGVKLEIENFGDLQQVFWYNFITKVNGSSTDLNDFNDLTRTTFTDISSNTDQRIKLLRERDSETKTKYESSLNDTINSGGKAENASLEFKKIWSNYNLLLTELQKERFRYHNLINNNQSLFLIDKDVTKICKIDKCPRVCIPMVTCDNCQNKVEIPSLKWNCQTRYTNIRSSQLVEINQMCITERKQFRTIYTGDCGQGGFFNDLFDWIFGCDDTYEVKPTRSKFTYASCKNYTMKVINTNVSKTECVQLEAVIDGGFSEPRDCNCQRHECKVKTTQLECVQRNIECQKQRKLMLQNRSKDSGLYRFFAKMYERMESIESTLEEMNLLVEQRQLEKDFSSLSHNRTKNRLLVAEQEMKLSKRNLEDAQIVFGEDLCVLKHFQDYKENFDHSVERFELQSRLPVVDNLQLVAIVKQSSTEKKISIPFYYEISDPMSSLLAAAKKIVYTSLCETSRKRRSTKTGNEVQFGFTSWDTRPNSTKRERSCMTFKLIMEYIKGVVLNLEALVKESSKIDQMISVDTKKPCSVINKTAHCNSSSYSYSLTNVLTEELHRIENQSSVIYVYGAWRDSAEIYTGGNNFTVCQSFKDCANTAFRSLFQLPVLVPERRNLYRRLLEIVKHDWVVLEDFKNNTDSLADLSYKILAFQESLKQLKNASLFCIDKPIIVEPNVTEHNVPLGFVLSLSCGNIQSELAVKYNWKRHSEYLDGEYGDSISIVASFATAGVYTCVVSSSLGQSSTSGILVNVYELPNMISQPEDAFVVLPDEETDIEILCEASGYPTPNITWFYKSYKEYTEIRLPQVGPQMFLDIKSNATNGYYYCKATNSFGETQSKPARVDTLQTELPSQYIEAFVVFVETASLSSVNLTISDFPDNFTTLFTSYEEQNVSFSVDKFNGFDTLHIQVEGVHPSSYNATSMVDLMQISKQTRKSLSIAVKKIVSWAASEQAEIYLPIPAVTFKAINGSLNFKATLDKCEPGFQMHSNGIVCVQCKAGFYNQNGSGQCKECPQGFYTPYHGSSQCLECQNGRISTSCRATRKHLSDNHDTSGSSLAKVYEIVGGGFIFLVIFFVTLIAFYRHFRKRQTNPRDLDQHHDERDESRREDFEEEESSIEEHDDIVLDSVGSEQTFSKDSCSPNPFVKELSEKLYSKSALQFTNPAFEDE